MNRKETTKFLTDLLIKEKLSDRKYYAREVTLDYGTDHPRRVDVMEFTPKGVIYPSDIEKGTFTCYEIKSCQPDIYSGNGLNFYGENNFIVTTMATYKAIQEDIRVGNLQRHICEFMGVKTCPEFGIMVPVPDYVDLRRSSILYDEYEKPSPLEYPLNNWKFWTVYPQVREAHRTRSMTELLFCMLRSKHSYTNMEEL